MGSNADYEFLAPESAMGQEIDFEFDADTYVDPADDAFDGLVATGSLYDEGAERHVRDVLGRVFGI